MREEINNYLAYMAAASMTWFSALAASMPFGGPVDLWDNSRFVMTCVSGAAAGAILITFAMPHQKMTFRKAGCEFFFAFMVGLIFSPPIIDHLHITRTTTWVLPSSAVVAMLGIGTLRLVVPTLKYMLSEWAMNKLRVLFGLPPPKQDTQKLE